MNGGATIKGNIPDKIQIIFISTDSDSVTTETHKLVASASIIIHRNIQFRIGKPVEEAGKIKIAVNY